MCTAVSYQADHHYFGRTLDLECSFGEQVTITPRNYPFSFVDGQRLAQHYAIIGMARIQKNYPLYYDAANEKGLSMAALNFPDHAFYMPKSQGVMNIAPFELIAWVLGQCKSVEEAKILLRKTNIADFSFDQALPNTPLHWMIADARCSIVVEPCKDGLHIHDNPVGVLTNNPPFETQMMNLSHYTHLTNRQPQPMFCGRIPIQYYSRGMGTVGLPGDFSSASRFVRAAFVMQNSNGQQGSVGQFFHVLGSVLQPMGSVQLQNGEYVRTVYTSCINTDLGIYYYTTYENQQITAVDLHREELDAQRLIAYDLITEQRINQYN
ncbi:MAG: choloylglycine hydrolase [Clostridia bacterium]|nr:choloylglycine hydrolase [Clostridia bacterium]